MIENQNSGLLKAKGSYIFQHVRDGQVIDEWREDNLVVDEGINHLLDVGLSNGTANPTWYVGLYKNNYTPIAGNVMATFGGAGVANEVTTEYSESTRPTWVEAGAVSKSITNTASPAAFTFTPASTSVYGAFLTSVNTKGGTTGVLFSAVKFSAVRTMLATDVLNVVYTVNATSS